MSIMLSSHDRTLELFPYFYHSTPFINDDDDKIFTWCLKQFGEIPIIGNSDTGIWCTTFRGYYFKDDKDYMLTVLRWT